MNPAQRYKFKNILGEDFTSYWGKNPITVKAGGSVTLPEYLANKMLDEMVDKIMMEEVKLNEVNYYKNNPNTAPNFYRAPSSAGVPAARKVWEDQIITKLPLEEGTTEAQLLRLQIKQEIEDNSKAQPSTEPATGVTGMIDTSNLEEGRNSLHGVITNEEEFSEIKNK